MTTAVRRSLDYAVVFVAYVATARLGLTFDALAGVATTVWPPTGIALAALVLRGPQLWPVVTLAALTVNIMTGIPIWGAAIIAAGNTLEAVVGAALLRRFSFDPRLARLRDVLLLVGWAALVSTMISASFGVAATALAKLQRAESYPVFWAVWWVGDAMGDLLIAPLICVWASSIRLSRRPLRWLEALLLAVALTLVTTVVFRRTLNVRAIELVRGTYVIVPLLIWAALRFEQRGTTATLILVAVVAVSATATVGSYFAARTPHERLLMTDCYMAITAVSMLTLGAALAERRAAIGVRDEFISIASHELKTPLTALKLRLTAAIRTQQRPAPRDSDVEEKLRRSLAAAGTTADRLVSLVEDLLDASRLTAGRLALSLESVALGDLVREVVGRVREQAAEMGSRIEIAIPEPIVGRWDRIRIEQIVTNLLSNAIKYGAGRPIHLSAHVVTSGRVRFQVKDEGVGISRADQSRIFQAFERVTTAHRVGGLGLGLYIGRQIAAAHGVTLSVDSKRGQGSMFTLELPLEANTSGATSLPPTS
ncbi:MAG TPA: MASE1 domain-containing protein [Polyangia bacterium]|nr:MASE1 domain-containing protein [Polyangia bacterium]